jgi:predicted SprT family Zn-dependent metalloprotease
MSEFGNENKGNDKITSSRSPLEYYKIPSDCTPTEFLAAAKLYSREIVDEYDLNVSVTDLDWEVSKRAKRRAGVVYHRNYQPTSIKLTWDYFIKKGWQAMASTIRHEIIHVHLLNDHNDPSHGRAFRRLAEELNTKVHCELFKNPKWWVICERCDDRIPRYKKSKLVTHPNRYKCKKCGGNLFIDEND